MDTGICQSCGIPVNEGIYGTKKDGTTNKDYCNHCYLDGDFTADVTMEEMLDICVPNIARIRGISEEDAREMMEELIPTLKRWI